MATKTTAPPPTRSNIANKVTNTHLPVTMPLLPLYEVISNSIHAIDEAKKKNHLRGGGGTMEVVVEMKNVER